MNAELVLLIYHQLVCMSDSEEIQEQLTVEQKPAPRYFGAPREKPEPTVSPKDNRPADTEKTLYRWNHVTDADWHTWGYNGRRNWIDAMVKKHGKSVVA